MLFKTNGWEISNFTNFLYVWGDMNNPDDLLNPYSFKITNRGVDFSQNTILIE